MELEARRRGTVEQKSARIREVLVIKGWAGQQADAVSGDGMVLGPVVMMAEGGNDVMRRIETHGGCQTRLRAPPRPVQSYYDTYQRRLAITRQKS